MSELWVGVDVSKTRLDVALRPSDEAWSVNNDQAGAKALASKLKKLAPHDLRRTCAKLCRKAGGELDQIQLLPGHASIQTTERYLGTEQALAHAVNDAIGLDMA